MLAEELEELNEVIVIENIEDNEKFMENRLCPDFEKLRDFFEV